MFASIFVLALPLLAAATAVPRDGSNVCNTGSLQCCNSVQAANSAAVQNAISANHLVNVVLGAVTTPVGVTCSPLSIVGLNSGSCTAQPVCCSNNSFNGVIAIGCTPINVVL